MHIQKLELCRVYLTTDDIQFGFKPNSACTIGTSAFITAVDYFRDGHSTVYAATLYIHKAFTYIRHLILLILIGLCQCLSTGIVNCARKGQIYDANLESTWQLQVYDADMEPKCWLFRYVLLTCMF